MLQPYTYLLVLFGTVIICFIASFDRRIRFDRYFGKFLLSSTIVALPFIFWDVLFTKQGVWWFDLNYTTGLTLAGLPVEEWLFFWCIPFACVFTYFCLDRFFDLRWSHSFNNIIAFVTVVVCSAAAIVYHNQLYTLVTAVITLLTVVYLHFIAKADWLGQASWVFLILMAGFFPVNGVLTGFGLETPVVNYNPKEFMGFRMFTIPVEDAVYGYSQFVLNIYFFKLFTRNEKIF